MWFPTLLSMVGLGCGPAIPPAQVATETLLPGDSDADSLCAVALDCWGNILDEPKVPCEMRVVSGSGAELYRGQAGVELHGRSSLTFPKPQYSVELRDHTELLVWPGVSWRYLDDGSDPGPGWTAPEYDDSGWKAGPAPLGYGDDWLNTVVDGGSPPDDVRATTYYRTTFSPANRGAIRELELGIIRNDAAAVYFNGVEVLRENLATDANYRDFAQLPIAPDQEYRWLTADVTPSLLRAEANVVAVEVHQAESESTDSRFDLYLDASGEEAEVDLLGMGDESDWSLNGMYVDRALLRNKLAFDVFQSFGGGERYAPESRYCELTLNGEYEGIYALGERIKRASSRLDLDDDGAPGESFIIKLDDEPGFHDNGVGTGSWQMVYPEPDGASEAEVSSFLSRWESAVEGDEAPTELFAEMDMASAVDWVILQELTKNVDAYQLSVYLWRDRGGPVRFTPWDFDLSMGYPYYDCGAADWLFRLQPVTAMAEDPAFHAALVSRWADLRESELSEATLAARIAAIDATLAPAIERNFERWPIGDIAFATDELDNWLCPVTSYAEEHARVVEFLDARLAWMDANIADY